MEKTYKSLCECVCVCAKLLQSCPIVCNPMDCSPPGSSGHGILQARILKWAAKPFSRGSSRHRDQTQVSYITGSNLCLSCLLHWQADSLPLASPRMGSPSLWIQTTLTKLFIFNIGFIFWPHQAACGTLVPQLGIEPSPLVMEAQSLNHWTASEVPFNSSLDL